jgi:WD40 repeat protein
VAVGGVKNLGARPGLTKTDESEVGVVAVLETKTGNVIWRQDVYATVNGFHVPAGVGSLTFPEDTGSLLGACRDGVPREWDVRTGEPRKQHQVRGKGHSYLTPVPGTTRVISWGGFDTPQVWDRATGKGLESFPKEVGLFDRQGISVGPDGRTAVLAGGEGVAVLDLDTGRLDKKAALPGWVREHCVAVGRTGRWFVTGGGDKVFRYWELTNP